MDRTQRLLTAILITPVMFAFVDAAVASPKANHHNGQRLLDGKIKSNGQHAIDKQGDNTVSVEVKNGKVAGVHVKHAKKGDVPVKKYKSSKKMAKLETDGLQNASFNLTQDQYLGMVYIGYAFVDEYGDEYIYWFPYDMIFDGDTGAIDYVPAL